MTRGIESEPSTLFFQRAMARLHGLMTSPYRLGALTSPLGIWGISTKEAAIVLSENSRRLLVLMGRR